MTGLLLLVPTLSLLILGAHFLRSANLALVIVALALSALQLLRRPWVPRLIQAALLLGAAEWVRTLLLLRAERMATGEPATRMVLILGAVAAVTLLSTLVYRAPALRRRYS